MLASHYGVEVRTGVARLAHLFFHYSLLEKTAIELLPVGQAVTCEEGRGPKARGPRRSVHSERYNLSQNRYFFLASR